MRKERNTQNTGSNPVLPPLFSAMMTNRTSVRFFPIYKHLISGGISDGGCGGGDNSVSGLNNLSFLK